MKPLNKVIAIFSVAALICCTSCKKNDNPDNDGMNKAPGSFEDNHTKMESDTTGTPADSTTSNSTQTDQTAS